MARSFEVVLELNERIVAMCVFREFVMVATERRVYRGFEDGFSKHMIFKEVAFEEPNEVHK